MTTIYIFKGRNGDVQAMNEVSAHNELRNKGAWQRQDLVYLGACDDRPLQGIMKEKREELIREIIYTTDKYKLLKSELELAVLQGNKDVENIKASQINVFIQSTVMDVKKPELRDAANNYYLDPFIDEIKIQLLRRESKIFEEAIEALKPDPKIAPRNFNKMTSNFGGAESNANPTDILSGII